MRQPRPYICCAWLVWRLRRLLWHPRRRSWARLLLCLPRRKGAIKQEHSRGVLGCMGGVQRRRWQGEAGRRAGTSRLPQQAFKACAYHRKPVEWLGGRGGPSPSGTSSSSSATARTTARTASCRGSGSRLPLHTVGSRPQGTQPTALRPRKGGAGARKVRSTSESCSPVPCPAMLAAQQQAHARRPNTPASLRTCCRRAAPGSAA